MAQFERLKLLIKESNIEKLKNSKVAVFGLGGVGSYVVEALARSGIGSFILVDNDTIDVTNINRQIIATLDSVGMDKVLAAKERILKINDKANIFCYKEFYNKKSKINILDCDYVIDAIDTVSSKIDLIEKCKIHSIPIISCMGTGNKLDPVKLRVSDLYHTSVCPLCRVMRRELKKRGIASLKVVYSEEIPLTPDFIANSKGRPIPGSTAFVPAAAGLIIASEVVKSLIDCNSFKDFSI